MKKTLLLFALMTLLTLTGAWALTAQDEQEPAYDFPTMEAFLAYIDRIATNRDVEDAQADLDALWAYLTENEMIPFIPPATEENVHWDDTMPVAFLYRDGLAFNVEWRGDFNGWSPTVTERGVRVNNTDLWLNVTRFPADARLDYKVVVNGGSWILDPNNPEEQLGGFGPNSELNMPLHVDSEWAVVRDDVDGGRLGNWNNTTSDNLGYAVRYKVYLPAGYNDLADLPVIYVTDGQDYANTEMGAMVNILDNMIADGVIEPVVAIFIDPRDPNNPTDNRREREYRENPNFATFVAEELVPLIDMVYNTSTDRADRVFLGASFGGLATIHMSVTQTDTFANFAVQSPSIWAVDDPQLYETFTTDLPMNYFVTNGVPEWDSWNINILLDWLESSGYEHAYLQVNQGHSWGNWRNVLDDMLRYFFSTEV